MFQALDETDLQKRFYDMVYVLTTIHGKWKGLVVSFAFNYTISWRSNFILNVYMSMYDSITLFLNDKRSQFPVQLQQHVNYEHQLAISLCDNQTDLQSVRYMRY